jgi:hypothetical protein
VTSGHYFERKTEGDPNQEGTHSRGYYTAQLFYERYILMPPSKKSGKPKFTLYANNVPGCVNFGDRYVALEDPTGWKISMELLDGDYKHWQALMKCSWFREAKEVWDEALNAKLQTRGLDVIQEIARGDSEEVTPAIRLQAAKFLATKGYLPPKEKSPRGRPSKEEVEGELKRVAELHTTVSEDLARIGKKGTN